MDFKGKLRPKVRLIPQANISVAAKQAIEGADLVVIAPGNLYGSLAPTLVVQGVAEAIVSSGAKKLAYVCNLVTKQGQTDGFKVGDFADEIERLLGGVKLDYLLYNNYEPSKFLLEKYAADNEYWVGYDVDNLESKHYKSIGGKFVMGRAWKPSAKKDLIQRTLIRHDANAVAKELVGLLDV